MTPNPASVKAAAVTVKNLTVSYGDKPVLRGVDLTVPRGSFAAIVGPNGAGKTTLLKTMLGLLKPLGGSVEISTSGRRGAIGYVPQSDNLDRDFPISAYEVALMGRYPSLGWFRRPSAEDKRIALDCLRRVGMDALARRQIGELSGGQLQRVFLARALAQDAEIYFLDEPLKGVDALSERAIIDILRSLCADGKTVVMVHHDLKTVRDYFDRVSIIGHDFVASGSTDEVFSERNIGLAYQAEAAI